MTDESESSISLSEGILGKTGEGEQLEENGTQMTLTGSSQGFTYTTFGLGASQRAYSVGLWAYGLGLKEKACPVWPMGSSPRHVSSDH